MYWGLSFNTTIHTPNNKWFIHHMAIYPGQTLPRSPDNISRRYSIANSTYLFGEKETLLRFKSFWKGIAVSPL